jgi:cation diffusion facilitator family transporter
MSAVTPAPSAALSTSGLARGRRLAIASVISSAVLALLNVTVGVWSDSTSVVAIGVEFGGDVFASTVVLVGLLMATRPPDANHPYGHGRLETLAALIVGMVLVFGGAIVSYRSLLRADAGHDAPGALAMAALLFAVVVRGVMSTLKFRVARAIGSGSLAADAWNDAVDILSAVVGLVAVGLARFDPARFLRADHYGGFIVGLIVVVSGLRIVREASFDLVDTMPDKSRLDEVRDVALRVAGVRGVEKQLARKTGLQYHVDLHLEVDPLLTVREGHQIAHDVRKRVRNELSWVADVLVHVEPAPDHRD